MIAPHYWLPRGPPGVPPAGVPALDSPPLWYPYLPAAYSPQAAAYAGCGYKLVPDSATGHCYIIPGR